VDLAAKNNIDLQLSGHTHRGQIFPSNLITGRLYELDWGLLTKDNYHLIVSSGYGTWGPPLRIGNHPEVVYITINFDPNKENPDSQT
jgi:predicted MPP superfamily phosphohydrolase